MVVLILQRLPVFADLTKESWTDSGISFHQITQADFLLYIAETMQGLKEKSRQEMVTEN